MVTGANMGMRQEVLGYSVQGRYLGRTAKAKMGIGWNLTGLSEQNTPWQDS